MSQLELANRMLDSLRSKDIDALVACMAEDVTMDTPMGAKKGKDQVRGMFKMVVSMGGSPDPATETDGVISARVDSPVTKSTMTLQFRDDLVSHIIVRIG